MAKRKRWCGCDGSVRHRAYALKDGNFVCGKCDREIHPVSAEVDVLNAEIDAAFNRTERTHA